MVESQRRPLVAGLLGLFMMVSGSVSANDAMIRVYSAGSLKMPLQEAADAYGHGSGIRVALTFGASGLLLERIKKGEAADVFASANMDNPETLFRDGLAGPVVRFARNRLCALARPEIPATTENLLSTLLDPKVRLGTSTPKSDPAGDYAWQMFHRAETVRPGSYATLDAKALKLTGGTDSAPAPEGRNAYGWLLESRQADVFLTYCTNALIAAKEVNGLSVIAIPPTLEVSGDYGVTVLAAGNREAANRFVAFILSVEGQAILAKYGFSSP